MNLVNFLRTIVGCVTIVAMTWWTWPVSAQTFDADVGLDPGHSYRDVGTSGGGLSEYELTLDIANRIRERLEAYGLRVRMTRTDAQPVSAFNHPDPTERTRIEADARMAMVGRVRAYVSIHFNGHTSGALKGTETYYNVDGAAGSENQRLATALQQQVISALWDGGYPAVDRGVKSDLLSGKSYGHFFGLRGDAPSVLVEGLFLTNPPEAAALGSNVTRDALAWGYVRGILEYLAATPAGVDPANLSFQHSPIASTTIQPDIFE